MQLFEKSIKRAQFSKGIVRRLSVRKERVVINRISLPARIIITVILATICALCVIPILSIVSISLSSQSELLAEGYSLFPRGFSLEGYMYVFKDMGRILNAYKVSLIRTLVGVVVGLVLNSLFAYVLSRPNYKYRTLLTIFLTIPMLLNAGLVPSYIWNTQYLHLKNTWTILILPLAVNPWHIIMMRTFFSQIPYELSESAIIDGAGEWTIYKNIVMPLSKPVLATIGMFLTLTFWNDWFQTTIYIDDKNMVGLQNMLARMMVDALELTRTVTSAGLNVNVADLPTETMRMAMCMVAAGPMLMVFPFFQKYFVKGLTVGGIKG